MVQFAILRLITEVTCPICDAWVDAARINEHLDNFCSSSSAAASSAGSSSSRVSRKPKTASQMTSVPLAPIFTPGHKNKASPSLSHSASHLGQSSISAKRTAEETIHPAHTKRNKSHNFQAAAPLAERLRPDTLEDFVGQKHLTGEDSSLLQTLGSSGGSVIFWGPPGCGKTSLARIIAKRDNRIFKELSATAVGTTEVRSILEEAKNSLALTGRKTVLFLDEIHRFNRSQQDIFLPYVEQGHIQLIGATTENPSFKITGALLSRCRVFVLERLSDDEMEILLQNALKRVLKSTHTNITNPDLSEYPALSSSPLVPTSQETQFSDLAERDEDAGSDSGLFTPKVISTIISLSAGDARTGLSLLELVLRSPKDTEDSALIKSLKHSVAVSYDRTGESHYDMISALHKSVRGSQGDAAMYWLARMLTAGEDPLYIARRMVVCASEDIGLADTHALPLAIATLQACQLVGMPECRINLAHLIAYLSEAPKSTRAYEAYQRAEEAAKLDPSIPVPLQMRNAPTGLMKDLGYGKDYAYNPSYAHPVHNRYLPIQLEGSSFLKREGDMTEKIWDENALRYWEQEVNQGKDWEGRRNSSELHSSAGTAPD